MSSYVPMTREAYNRIKAEVERLEQEEMPQIAEKIAVARAEGDLREKTPNITRSAKRWGCCRPK
jgi:transcription elongation factor GreA